MAGKTMAWEEQYRAQPAAGWSGKACQGCGAAIPDYRGRDEHGVPLSASFCLRCILITRPGELRTEESGLR